MTEMQAKSLSWMLVAGLLLAVVLPAPWQLAVTNEEAHHHAELWRNWYRAVLSTGSVVRRFADLSDTRVIGEFMPPADCDLLPRLPPEHELLPAPPGKAAKASQSADAEPANSVPSLREFKAGLYCHKPLATARASDGPHVSA